MRDNRAIDVVHSPLRCTASCETALVAGGWLAFVG